MKILLTILIIFIHFTSAEVKTLSKSHRFQGNNLIFQRFSFIHTTLFYALCDHNENSSEKQCSIAREINAFDSSSDTSYCDLTLRVTNPNFIIDSSFLIVAFGIDKSILVWLEKSAIDSEASLKMTIVRMSSCDTTEASLNFYLDISDSWDEHLDFVIYIDTYEIVVKNLSVCSDISIDRYCRLEYDADGNKVAGPLAWFTPLYEHIEYVVSVAPRSSREGYLLVEKDYEGYHVYLVQGNGTRILELGEEPSSDDDYQVAAFTTTNNAIGMCYHGDGKFTCWQYDQAGKLSLVIEFDSGLTANKNLRVTTMHNMREGGFLIMTVYCPHYTCRGNENDRYYLTKVDLHRRISGPKEIERIQCDEIESSAWAQFFQNDNGDYCLARLCWNNGRDARLDILTQCYPQEFFSS